MSLFPWALIFLGLCILGAGLLTLVGVKLWRSVNALTGAAVALADSLSRVGGVRAGRGQQRDDPGA